MVMERRFKNLPLFLLAGAIALSPSFSAGTFLGGKIIEIRIEDFLIIILGLIWIADFLISGRKKVEKPPLFFPILAWLGVGFFSILTNWIFGNIGFSRGFFYFLKEIEFFIIYFYVFYHIKSIDSAKFLIKLWVVLGLMNVGWVIYQVIRGSSFVTKFGFRSGEYFTSAIGEWGVFPTGAFFLMIFVFLFNILLYYFLNLNISVFKKGVLMVVILGPIIGIIGSASKTSFLALVLAITLSLFLLFLRRKNLKILLAIILISIFIFSVCVFAFQSIPEAGKRISYIFNFRNLLLNYEKGRLEPVIKPVFKEALQGPLYLPFFGLGKGYVTEAHNQYLRNFIETGIIGSLIFFILIFAIIKKSWQGFSKNQDKFTIGLSAGFLVATLTMLFLSLATEPFIVVKPSEVYWFFAALTMAVLSIKAKEKYAK